jgi:outer membrane receptor protein involved in Fe transport
MLVAGPTPPAMAQIEQVVVQARGQNEEVRDIPVAITAVSEKQMAKFAIKSLEDVAAIAPQLTIVRAGSGSGASISIRGIQSSNTSIGIEQSVAVILDGVYYPQGRVIDEGLFDVSQVAILKGPQSLYFGKNATAGVLSISTNNPGAEFESMARVGYEIEQKRLVGEAMISVPVTDKFGIRLAVRGTKMSGGYIDNIAGPTVYNTLDAATFTPTAHPNGAPKEGKFPAEESIYARLTVQGTPSDRFTYTIKGAFADYQISTTQGTELWNCPTLNGQPHSSLTGVPLPNLDAECVADWKGAQNPIPPDIAATDPLLSFFGNELGEEYRSYAVTGNFDWDLDPVDITAILNFHRQRTNWVGDFDGGGATAIFAGEHNTFRNFSTEVRARTKFEFPLNGVLGVYYQKTHRFFNQDVIFAGADNSAVTDPTRRYIAYDKFSETSGETISVYGELIWDITDTLELTGGVRYMHETKDSFFIQPYVNPFFTGLFVQGVNLPSDQTFKDASPEVTLRWQASSNVTLYAAYKEGFKSGGFSNSAILSALTVTQNPDGSPNYTNSLDDFQFNPEHVKGFEGGVKASLFDDTLSLEFEAYRYKFKDLQIDFFNSPTFAFITENAGGSTTTGAEIQFTWVPKQVEGLTLTGSLAYNEASYSDFIAPCYAGQRPSQGCTIFNPGQLPKQQLGGQTRPLAPKWSGTLGLDYERPLGNGLQVGLSTNVKFKSKYLLGAFNNPYDVQKGFTTLDASLRFGDEDGHWELAVIGKNLTNKYALVSSGDTPSTGGGTGTEQGFVADRFGTPIIGRTIEIQLTWRY